MHSSGILEIIKICLDEVLYEIQDDDARKWLVYKEEKSLVIIFPNTRKIIMNEKT